MAASSFAAALGQVLRHEGGFVNHPSDPGGATNRGVTQAVYDAYRDDEHKPRQSVRMIRPEEVEAIYRERYWAKVRGDDLPAGVDYAVFDFAVHSGVNRASRFLQRAVGTVEDGMIGPKTLAAAWEIPPRRIIEAMNAERLNFLRGIGTFRTFGRGWTRRVAEVEQAATEMAA